MTVAAVLLHEPERQPVRRQLQRRLHRPSAEQLLARRARRAREPVRTLQRHAPHGIQHAGRRVRNDFRRWHRAAQLVADDGRQLQPAEVFRFARSASELHQLPGFAHRRARQGRAGQRLLRFPDERDRRRSHSAAPRRELQRAVLRRGVRVSGVQLPQQRGVRGAAGPALQHLVHARGHRHVLELPGRVRRRPGRQFGIRRQVSGRSLGYRVSAGIRT